MVLTEGGFTYTELREMPIPEFEVVVERADVLAAKIKRAQGA